jgi:hypothetical protein
MDAYKPPKQKAHMEHRVTTLEARMEMLVERTNDLETRLRGIEKSVWKSTGVLAALQVLLTVVLALAVKFIK